jgi:hypothetical protein
MNIIPAVVMVRLISGQCVQSLVQRNKRQSFGGNKDLKGKLVPHAERKILASGNRASRAFAPADSEDRT